MSMTKIATVTVGVLGAASIDFTSIPGTMTDLVLAISARTNRLGTADGILISFNGSTSSFSYRALRGSGSAASSFSGSRLLGDLTGSTATSNTFASLSVTIPNYAGSTNKSYSSDSVSEQNATEAFQYAIAGLWSNTAAITGITLTPEVGSAFAQYSTATLYGVTKGSLAGVTVS